MKFIYVYHGLYASKSDGHYLNNIYLFYQGEAFSYTVKYVEICQHLSLNTYNGICDTNLRLYKSVSLNKHAR